MEHKYIKCPKCGNKTQVDFPYCNYCGAKLEKIMVEEIEEKDKIILTPHTDNPTSSGNGIPSDPQDLPNNATIKGKNKFLSVGFIIMMLVGIALFIYGCTIKIPNEKLSYYAYEDASQIDKYVGGDAYNYIIGAEIVGSKIVAAKTEKAIFICSGLFMASLGGAIVAYEERKQNKSKSEIPSRPES